MNTIIEKIRAEVERQLKNTHDWLNGKGAKKGSPRYYEMRGRESAFDSVLSRLSDLEKECEKQNDQDVNLAANNWICSHKDGEILYIKPAFIAGAEWQKEQMMKEAVEVVVWDAGVDFAPHPVISVEDFNVKDGDKVRIIIVKED